MYETKYKTIYETAYKPKCSVTYEKACETVYETVYETDYKEKCYTAYQSVCEKIYRTEYKQECETSYEKACTTSYTTTYKEQCQTSYKEECSGYGYHKQCHKVAPNVHDGALRVIKCLNNVWEMVMAHNYQLQLSLYSYPTNIKLNFML